MKSILQHYKKATTYFVLFVALLAFTTSCQDEEMIIENPPPEETIVADSTLTNSMRTMAMNEIEITTEAIDCIDFVYPISFSVYNTDFVIIDTVVINNAQELLVFLASLGINPNQIVSLNFPVSLQYENGTIVEANNNLELLNIIITALTECDAMVDPENPCPALIVEADLQQCFWYPKLYDTTNEFEYNHFTFINDSVYRMSAFGYEVEQKYDTYDFDNKTFIRFRENQVPILDFVTGEWEVQDCENNELSLLHTGFNVEMLFARDCELDLANCFGSGQGICDDDLDGFVEVDFNAIANQATCAGFEDYSITFHLTRADAQAQVNALPSPYLTTVPNTQQFYYAIVENATGLLKYVSAYQIDAENCGGCDNPGVLTDDLIVYVPFGNEVQELVNNEFSQEQGSYISDRDDNSNCALNLVQNNTTISINTNTTLANNDPVSISFWFKMQNNDAGDLETIFSNETSIGGGGFTIGVFDLNTPLVSITPNVQLWDNDWNNEIDVQWDNTDWHHLVLTLNEAKDVKLYRDGILRNEALDTGIDAMVFNQFNAFFIDIVGSFEGHFDDLRVYKKALNPNEIFTLFNLEGDCYTCLD